MLTLNKTLKLLLTTALMTLVTFSAFPQMMHSTETEVLKGEKWWGLYISGSPAQPFDQQFRLKTMTGVADGATVSVLLSSNGRYLYSQMPFEVDFDGEILRIHSQFESVTVQKGGRNLREAYLLCCHNNFAPEGDMPDEALFTLPQYETAFDPGCFSTQDDIIAYAQKLLSEGFPPGIIVIADGWDRPNSLYSFSREVFPDPAALVATLHELGFKVMLTVTPYCSPYGKNYLDGVKNGIFVTGKDNRPVIVRENGGYAACYDFRSITLANEARANLRGLMSQYGVDGLRFECTGLLAKLGADSHAANNYLESWVKLHPGTGICEFLPYVGKPFAPTITGIARREEGDWLTSSIATLVSAGLTGYPYSTLVNLLPDGGELPQDDSRLAEYLLLESAMPVPRVRYAPWRIKDPALYAAVKDAVNFRAEIADYIAELVDESAKMAAPMLRHMEYVFPKSGFWDCDDQFMLGNHYLFAPVTSGETKRMVRLPKGTWYDREGRRFKGPLVTEVDCRDGRVICFTLNGK